MMNQIKIIPELNIWMKEELSNSSVYDTYHKIPILINSEWKEPSSIIDLLFNENFQPTYYEEYSSSSSNDIRPYVNNYKKIDVSKIKDEPFLNRIRPYLLSSSIFIANSSYFISKYNIQEEDEDYGFIETFTDLTFEMLNRLWDYKIYDICDIQDINYQDLDSSLSKLIFIYLDAILNKNFNYFQEQQSISEDVLSSLYEKHVLNMLYLLKQKSYGIIWKDSVLINNNQEKINENYFLITQQKIKNIIVDLNIIANEKIILDDENLPWDKRDFTFFKNGSILEQDEDYVIITNIDDPENIFLEIKLLNQTFKLGEHIKLIWSYADPKSAFVED